MAELGNLPVITDHTGLKLLAEDAGGAKLIPVENLPTPPVPEGVPSGVIAMWSGLASAIPSGWSLCDGTGSTPNLVGKFIKGANAGNVGETGGSETHSHSHSLSAGAHTLSVSQMPSHNHLNSLQNHGGPEYPESHKYSYGRWSKGGHGNTQNTGGNQSHSHSLAGSINSASNVPPYYALCFIIKD